MKPRIAVFSGPTATIQNSPPLVTSNKARAARGLPPMTDSDGLPLRYDVLRPQRLAAPVTIYIEQFSAHPLERDAAGLYGPPDGFVDTAGSFSPEQHSEADTPVYVATLQPDDGLYPLPYMALQTDGSPWNDAVASPLAPVEFSRQTFYPDASRIFEEINRFGLNESGSGNQLAALAEFDFYRPAPSGGYQRGLGALQRTDAGEGDIAPERWGEDFFMYYPFHLRREPYQATLARATNVVACALASGDYLGALWLEGSPTAEESIYWLNLLVDTDVPIVAHSSQRAHGLLSNDGDRNIVDGVSYITSRAWADGNGQNVVGAVMIVDELIFAAREVQKGDARPGGYVTTGGHGGLLGNAHPPLLMFVPRKRHTHCSAVNLSRLPACVEGVRQGRAGIERLPVAVKAATGGLVETVIPKVTIEKYGRYLSDGPLHNPAEEVSIMARIERNLRDWPLAGFVGEGTAPYGTMNEPADEALRCAVFSGMPVVKVGRGDAHGVVPIRSGVFISGSNLTATKARLLLMACLLRFGSLPPAADPASPTDEEIAVTSAHVAEYQAVFDTH